MTSLSSLICPKGLSACKHTHGTLPMISKLWRYLANLVVIYMINSTPFPASSTPLEQHKMLKHSTGTVDGRNPTPRGMHKTLKKIGWTTLITVRLINYWLVQDFFHQEYHCMYPRNKKHSTRSSATHRKYTAQTNAKNILENIPLSKEVRYISLMVSTPIDKISKLDHLRSTSIRGMKPSPSKSPRTMLHFVW